MSQQPFVPSIPRQAKPSQPVPELLARIQAHPLDKPGAAFKFSERLALENGWPLGFTERVIEEYRRFVYLACLGEGEVTPSDEVDQAWHLHLAYSRDYWEAFCPNALGRPLHHGPTDGGGAEAERYEANYGRTLELYERVFGARPPADIWPPAAIRFKYAPANVRVNKLLFAITPRQKPKRRFVNWIGALCFLAVLWVILSPAPPAVRPGQSMFVWVFGLCVAYFVLQTVSGLASSLWRTFGPSRQNETIIQPQHGYTVAFTVGAGVLAGVAAAEVTDVAITGNGSGEGGSGGGDGGGGYGDSGGSSGCGSGCGGGGCGGGGCGGGS